jgi:hypothetical protein
VGHAELGDEPGLALKLRAVPTITRIRRVVADVHDRRHGPVDPGGPQHPPDPPRLELGQDEVVRLAELLCRERARPAGARRQAHDVAALGVDRHEELLARQRPRAPSARP